MKVEDAIRKVAEEMNLPYEVARTAYFTMYRFIREKMSELPLQDDLTDEEFSQLRPNFNVPSLGKFYVTLDRYHSIKKMLEYIKEATAKKYDIQNLQD